MKTLFLVRYAFGVAGAVGILTACSTGGSQPGFGAGVSPALSAHKWSFTHDIGILTRAGIVPVAHPARQKSWVSPAAAKSEALLYVPDDGKGSVEVFDYKSLTLVGEATGFKAPEAACSDANGNVYVADYDASTISEFAYGSTSVERTITDGEGPPQGCSVNPTNGALAVTNFYSETASGGLAPGGVLIYANASGTPTFYSGAFYDWPAGYDPSGNLWMEGNNEGNSSGNCSSGVCLEELASGGSSFSVVTFSETLHFAGAVQWDGKYLGVSDQETGGADTYGIYESTTSASGVTSVNLVKTTDDCHGTDTDAIGWAGDSKLPDDIPGALEKYIAFGNLWCENRFDEFHYPAGGKPKKSYFLEEYAYSPTIVAAPRK